MINKISLLIIFMFLSVNAWATTYYIRDGGGTPTQCTGTTNAVYPGSGTNQPCAINHPAWILGTPSSNGPGSGPTATSGLISSGDTVYIVGDSDVNPGQQAQYFIGYGMPNTNTSQCASAYTGGCFMAVVPAGPNSSTLTKVIGIGTRQPQLWGDFNLGWLLDISQGYVDIENIEGTFHGICSDAINGSNPSYGGYQSACNGTHGVQLGLEMAGSYITTKNLWFHNFSTGIISVLGLLSNWSSTNDRFIASGEGNTQGGNGYFGGNNTLTNDIIAWGGCMEKYPLPDPSNFKDLNNYINCADQNAGGYALGGGLVMQYNGNAACGNWTISNTQIDFNLKSNIDFLHCDGTGTFNFYRSRSEGSSGEALKINVQTLNIEESQLIGNAPIWDTTPFQNIKAPYNLSGGSWNYLTCRGNAVTNFAGNPNEQVNFINDTVTGNCTSLVEVNDTGYAAATCNGMAINSHNTNFLSGYAADTNRGQSTNLFYVGGADGNGGGTVSCNAGQIPLNLYYSNAYNLNDTSDCTSPPASGVNSHTNCNTDPQVLFEATSSIASELGPTAYYSGTSFGDQFYLQSSSPLKGSASSSGVTYTNGSSNDYNNVTANSPMDIGSIQYGSTIASSTAPTNGYCSISNQCSSNSCSTSGYCIGSCNANGSSCSTGSTCCSSLCQSSLCVSCLSLAQTCSSNGNCCSGLCQSSSCVSCLSNAQSCTTSAQCCSGYCNGSLCSNGPVTASGTLNCAITGQTIISGKTIY